MLKSFVSVFLLVVFSLPALAKEPIKVPLGDAPTRGAEDAPVTMVEFVDFQ